MALINCPECGKEVSDKAKNCPSCGYPLMETASNTEIVAEQPLQEEYLCCPKCMSKELHAEKSGFSGGKAAAGFVLAGGVGLLAGTIGSRDIKITCLKCGNQFKAGEAKIVKQGESLNKLEEKMIQLLCDSNTVSAVALYRDTTHCSLDEAYKKTIQLLDAELQTPKYTTPEQQTILKKVYEDIKSGKGGCLGIVVIMIALSSFLLMLYIFLS